MVTAEHLLDYLRTPAPLAAPLPAGKVHYGLADGIGPPLLSVRDFRRQTAYDTAGPALHTLTFTLAVTHAGQDQAEALMAQYLPLLENQSAVPTWFKLAGGFVDDYAVTQAELFVFEVTAAVTLLVSA